MEKTLGQRNSSFELLRIICMLMIVAGHVIISHEDTSIADHYISQLVRSFTVCAVNVFVMISGFFGIRFKLDRLIRMDLQVWFYAVSSLVFLIVVRNHIFVLKKDCLIFLPIITKQYWFVTAYFALYLISPWLNKYIQVIDKKELESLLILGGGLFYLWPTFNYLVNANQLIMDAGYGIVNFVYLYLLGRYIRIFGFLRNLSRKGLILFYVCSAILLFLCQEILSYLLGFQFSSWLSYNTIFVLAESVFMILLFERKEISSRTINTIAAPALAVYLFHMAPPDLWNYIVKMLRINNFHGFMYLIILFVLPVLIYFTAFVIERVRLCVFERGEQRLCDEVASLRVMKLLQKCVRYEKSIKNE